MGKRRSVGGSGCLHRKPVGFLVSTAIAVVLVCLSPTAGQAQLLYGSLTGVVTDASGAAIAGAKVEALNVGTGVTRSATTDGSGGYHFSELQEGTYRVTISNSGFATFIAENVPIAVSFVRRIDAQLKVSSQTQVLTVSAEAQALQTETAEVNTHLSSTVVENLPTAGSQGRNFQSLLRVIPGAQMIAETNSLAANTQRAINVNVNGQSNQSVNTRIDGTQNAYPWLPANVAYVPQADAIERSMS